MGSLSEKAAVLRERVSRTFFKAAPSIEVSPKQEEIPRIGENTFLSFVSEESDTLLRYNTQLLNSEVTEMMWRTFPRFRTTVQGYGDIMEEVYYRGKSEREVKRMREEDEAAVERVLFGTEEDFLEMQRLSTIRVRQSEKRWSPENRIRLAGWFESASHIALGYREQKQKTGEAIRESEQLVRERLAAYLEGNPYGLVHIHEVFQNPKYAYLLQTQKGLFGMMARDDERTRDNEDENVLSHAAGRLEAVVTQEAVFELAREFFFSANTHENNLGNVPFGDVLRFNGKWLHRLPLTVQEQIRNGEVGLDQQRSTIMDYMPPLSEWPQSIQEVYKGFAGQWVQAVLLHLRTQLQSYSSPEAVRTIDIPALPFRKREERQSNGNKVVSQEKPVEKEEPSLLPMAQYRKSPGQEGSFIILDDEGIASFIQQQVEEANGDHRMKADMEKMVNSIRKNQEIGVEVLSRQAITINHRQLPLRRVDPRVRTELRPFANTESRRLRPVFALYGKGEEKVIIFLDILHHNKLDKKYGSGAIA